MRATPVRCTRSDPQGVILIFLRPGLRYLADTRRFSCSNQLSTTSNCGELDTPSVDTPGAASTKATKRSPSGNRSYAPPVAPTTLASAASKATGLPTANPASVLTSTIASCEPC